MGTDSSPASGIPASGIRANGEWRPLVAGHVKTLTSGHRAPRVYGPLAQMLAAGLETDRPDLAAYPETVAAWATAEAVAALLRRHLAEVGTVDLDTKQPRTTTLTELHRAENSAAKHRATLGLDPRSEAALARERAEVATLVVDLEALAERGRQALAAREQAGLPAPPDLAGEVLVQAREAAEAERAEKAAEWAEEQARRAAARQAAKQAKREEWYRANRPGHLPGLAQRVDTDHDQNPDPS
jgi:hypothetical protein